ncbi:hypothetical protein AB835_02215 [Candidatus Endobugula sertula]|uniref:FAD-binding domain-containing protein n=1 Tax=Candidatus Endobugula sertula TaxID=62101 RepID=A0A1D2QT11_9GAMM|nr:hypothetical protein AB835_02215 [Candidatus Endobugula sertula]
MDFLRTDRSMPHITIVGGGMVGISLALMLSKVFNGYQQTVSVALIEQLAFPAPPASELAILPPSFDARSTALSAGSITLLHHVSIWNLLQEHAEAIKDIHVSDTGHYGSTLLHAETYSVDALGYVVENRWLGQCLCHQLQQQKDIQCLSASTVEQCTFTQQGPVLSIRQGESINRLETDLVLIADGANSPLRQSLGIDKVVTTYQQSAIVTNIAVAKPHKGMAYERFTAQGPLALLPLADCDGQHRMSVVWTRHTDNVGGLMALDNSDFLQELQQCFGFRGGYFIDVGQRYDYPLQLVQASEQVRSGLVVVGNAAHFLHPVGGQGFNLSLRDCATLVDVLHQAYQKQQILGSYKVLKEYEVQRERDQQLTIGLTDAMVKTFSTQQLSLSILRQMGFLGLQALPHAKKVLAHQMMGIA